MNANTNKKGHKRGFTLIELLVVIAIIGILASVVLASLNTARQKGKDASAKSAFNQVRAGAEIIYSSANSYIDMCPLANGSVGTALSADKIVTALSGAASAYAVVFGPTVYYTTGGGTPGTPGDTSCQGDADEYVAQVYLADGTAYCVDNVGFAGVIQTVKSGNLPDGSMKCQ